MPSCVCAWQKKKRKKWNAKFSSQAALVKTFVCYQFGACHSAERFVQAKLTRTLLKTPLHQLGRAKAVQRMISRKTWFEWKQASAREHRGSETSCVLSENANAREFLSGEGALLWGKTGFIFKIAFLSPIVGCSWRTSWYFASVLFFHMLTLLHSRQSQVLLFRIMLLLVNRAYSTSIV